MKVLVCGSRHFSDRAKLDSILSTLPITEVIEGEARGADRLSRDWAVEHKIPTKRFPANWELYGKRAGPIRNSQMLKEGQPELVVAFLAPNSRGTADMIAKAKAAGVETLVIDI